MTLAYLNGKYLPLAEAKVSALDRGFLLGDGVYEVIPVYHNHLLHGEEHLHRLDNSLKAIDIKAPLTHQQWFAIFEKLLAESHEETCSIYLQITRGADTKRNHYFPPATVQPTVFAYVSHSPVKTKAELERGYKVTLQEDIRWQHCFIKAITLLPNLLLLEHAKQAGFDDVVMLRDNIVTEGCSSNVFIVKDGEVLTPPLSKHILGGITRELVLEILEHHNAAFRETEITREELLDADEIWLTSSTKEIAPVIKIDDQVISHGKAGPMWHKAYGWYQDYVRVMIHHD